MGCGGECAVTRFAGEHTPLGAACVLLPQENPLFTPKTSPRVLWGEDEAPDVRLIGAPSLWWPLVGEAVLPLDLVEPPLPHHHPGHTLLT